MLPGVSVVQPPHLEGDASLATEILPGPPPAATIQQMALKRDPKKPSMAYSYLPPSDPGSTYSGIMHGTLVGLDPEGCSKRAKDKGCVLRLPFFQGHTDYRIFLLPNLYACTFYVLPASWNLELLAGELNGPLLVSKGPVLFLLPTPQLRLLQA